MGAKRRGRAVGRRQGEGREPVDAGTARSIAWQDHIGAAVGLAALAYVAVRILAVSNYSMETAYALIQVTGAVNVGLGAMLALIPVLAAICWFAVFVLMGRDILRRQPGPAWRWFALTVLLWLGAFMVPLVLFAEFLALGVLALGVESRTGAGDEGRNRNSHIVLAVILALAMVPYLISRAPWFPPERIEVENRRPFTAYVLAEENGTVTLLGEDPRAILRIEKSRLESRRICHIEKGRFWEFVGMPLWVPGGTIERIQLVVTNENQDDRLGGSDADRPADVPAGQDPRTAQAVGGPVTKLNTQFYAPAIDAEGNADCETGQHGYPAGPLNTTGRYAPSADPNQSGGSHVVLDPAIPGLAGGTYKARELGIDNLEDVP